MGPKVSLDCYPFQVAGTHDTFRPLAAYEDGLPSKAMYRENYFYDAGNGLIIFRGEEPWFHIEIFAEAFFQAIKELGIKQTASVEGVNGPVPPDLERRVTCVYSKPEMREALEKYGLQFSSYGSEGRRGPTIAMALVSLAHFEYPEVEMFRLGSMAPMYPFSTTASEQVGIPRDHRSYYDIMRRLKSMFKLEIDLAELQQLGETESQKLQETLEKISESNREAKQLIDSVRSDYNFTPFEELVELDPALDKTLEDILRNMPE
jgi:predicted ATP-grasp superfamily ATP-dependent carboligase